MGLFFLTSLAIFIVMMQKATFGWNWDFKFWDIVLILFQQLWNLCCIPVVGPIFAQARRSLTYILKESLSLELISYDFYLFFVYSSEEE